MSSTDNAKNKLLDSIRLSKSGAAETPATDSAATAGTPPEPVQAPPKAAVRKPAAKKHVAPKKKASPAKKPEPKKKAIGQDPYQGARRIWPD